MTFLTPLLAGIAAAIAIPSLVILYFLKLRRRDVEVSTTLLWKQAVQDMQANAPFQKLRKNILLLIQLIVLALILLAIAQPAFRGTVGEGGRIVMYFDRSASMGALDETDDDGEPISRLQRAKLDAIAWIEAIETPGLVDRLLGRGSATEVMVVSFDTDARIEQQFTASIPTLVDTIRGIGPTETPTSFRPAAALTQRIVGARTFRINERDVEYRSGDPAMIWSDGSASDFDALDLHPESVVTWNRMGAPDTVNHGIVAMSASRDMDSPGEFSVFVSVQSNAEADATFDVELAANGLALAVRSITIPGRGDNAAPTTGGVTFTITRSEGITLEASLIVEDALGADNTARIAVPPARRLSVGLVSGEGNLFLNGAFEILNLTRFERMTPDEYESLRGSGQLGGFDVMVFDRFLPEGVAFDENSPDGGMPPGRYLIWGATPPIRGALPPRGERPPSNSAVIDWDRRHPALQYIGLEPLVAYEPIDLRAASDDRVLVRGTSGPLMAEFVGLETHAIVTAFDPGGTTHWPWDSGFIVFIAQAIRYLAGDGEGLEGQSIGPGETLTTRLPSGVQTATLTVPGGLSERLPVGADGAFSYAPIERTGLYTIEWDGPGGPNDVVVGARSLRTIPANLFDPRESDIRVPDAIALDTRDISAANDSQGTFGIRRLWPWLILAGIALIMFEWWVYNRRVAL